MKNKYVDFISDEHLLYCIANLHKAYLKAKNNITKKNFYSNKVDTIKLTFDAQFNDINQESLIQAEILRQIDKSINNSIGTFHEQILGGIKGFHVGNLSGFDIKANDDTLFAIFKFENLSKNIEECIFEKLSNDAQRFKNAKFYFVDFTIEDKNQEKWIIGNDEYKVSHKNVFKISGTSFYNIITQTDDSLNLLQKSLQTVLTDFLTIT
ncbi:MAG: Eco47II family restriction endonuclease [Flavobacterium sp.]|uniref:Eco47II family restriction endonuclease n=1 Tax=Flavobacterium sp. TaxID=239 RepID=UPI00260AA499|nr:Eco47II family restriction endonuclease [Flavobacterium sp.]MDD5151161.1 Eco47II family restriction endonuclease [Flavobacterium sp.]